MDEPFRGRIEDTGCGKGYGGQHWCGLGYGIGCMRGDGGVFPVFGITIYGYGNSNKNGSGRSHAWNVKSQFKEDSGIDEESDD